MIDLELRIHSLMRGGILPMNEFSTSLLGIPDRDMLGLNEFEKNNIQYYDVTLANHGGRCPQCGAFVKKVKEYRFKQIDHAVLIKKKGIILYHARRFQCPKCGTTFYEKNPFIEDYEKISSQTEENVLKLLKDYNQTFSSAARATGMSKTKAMQIFDEHVQIPRKNLTETICIDEFYFSRTARKKFALMILNFKNGAVLDILSSREKHRLLSYFHAIPRAERERVHYVSIDMNDVYRDTVKQCFPNAVLCVDSFHVMENLSRALDDVRLRIMRRYEDRRSDEYYLLKYQKQLLFRDIEPDAYHRVKVNHHFRYAVTDQRKLEMMLAISTELKSAFYLKEEYTLFNQTQEKDPDELRKMLENLADEFLASEIPEMVSISLMLKNWEEEILNSFQTIEDKGKTRRISNGPIEGRNKLIKILLRLANGYENFDRFRNRAIYVLNKMEQPSSVRLKNTVKHYR